MNSVVSWCLLWSSRSMFVYSLFTLTKIRNKRVITSEVENFLGTRHEAWKTIKIVNSTSLKVFFLLLLFCFYVFRNFIWKMSSAYGSERMNKTSGKFARFLTLFSGLVFSLNLKDGLSAHKKFSPNWKPSFPASDNPKRIRLLFVQRFVLFFIHFHFYLKNLKHCFSMFYWPRLGKKFNYYEKKK